MPKEKEFDKNISEMKVLFASDSIIIELKGYDVFDGRSLIVKWEAILDDSFNKQGTVKWAKPYENEEIDSKTKREILYYLCVELAGLDYKGYRNEYVGDEIREAVDTIINLGDNHV